MHFNALFVHGVGQQEPDFAHSARRWLREALEPQGIEGYFMSTCWAPLADKFENKFLADAEAHGTLGNLSQDLTIKVAADALLYQSNEELRLQIWALLDRQADAFCGQPFHIFAHSLGCLIATDWLRATKRRERVTLVTLACNIGLFKLGQNFEPVPAIWRAGGWLNYFSKRDALGFPMAGVTQGTELVEDHQVSLGGLFRGWTGLAHTLYWTEKSLWKKRIPTDLGLLNKR